MNKRQLEKIVHRDIPMSKKMGVRVARCDKKEVRFRLPLSPNRNHQGTAFGGTLIGAEALCAWSWIMNYLSENKKNAVVVIKTNSSQFFWPVKKDFIVSVKTPKAKILRNFLSNLNKKGRGHITIQAEVLCQKKTCVTFTGEYVAFLPKGKR